METCFDTDNPSTCFGTLKEEETSIELQFNSAFKKKKVTTGEASPSQRNKVTTRETRIQTIWHYEIELHFPQDPVRYEQIQSIQLGSLIGLSGVVRMKSKSDFVQEWLRVL